MRIRKLLVSFFGLGNLPGPTGTYGSLGAVVVFLVIAALLGPARTVWIWSIAAVLAVLAAAVGIALGRWTVEFYKKKDPGVFVLDEVAGMWIALIAVPFVDTTSLLWVVLVQFLVFRVADIVKPPPARQAERMRDGWGIVTDDLVAAVYANAVGQVVFRALLPYLSASSAGMG